MHPETITVRFFPDDLNKVKRFLAEVEAELRRIVRTSAKFGITPGDIARIARDLERH